MNYAQTMKWNKKRLKGNRLAIVTGMYGKEKKLHDFFCLSCNGLKRTYNHKQAETAVCDGCLEKE